MKKNDKIIVAFLVSLGIFSSGVATQYVKSLSQPQKQILFAASSGNETVSTDNTNTLPVPKKK